jgi:hypothetical protein
VKVIIIIIINIIINIISVGANVRINQDNNNQNKDQIHPATLFLAKIDAYCEGFALFRIYEIVVTHCNSIVIQ